MSSPEHVAQILMTLSRHSGHPKVTFDKLLSFTHKYLEKHADSDPSLADLDDNTENVLTAHLLSLESEGRVTLSYEESQIGGVYFAEYFPRIIEDAYEKIHSHPHVPLVTEETLGITIPTDTIHPVDVRSDFVEWLSDTERSSSTVLRLMFPEGLESIIATLGVVRNHLASISLQKIRDYLRNKRNAGYMHSKLRGVFPNRDVALKETINKILSTPDEALKAIYHPTDFTFHFWTTLSSAIIKDFSQKQETLEEEVDYSRAAYLIGYYNVYYKGVEQRKKETEAALHTVDAKLRKEPYAYKLSDVHSFTDSKGVALTKRCSRSTIDNYIREKLLPPDDLHMPELLRIKAADGQEYYIRKDSVFKIVFPELHETAETFERELSDKWTAALKENEQLKEMHEDRAFEHVLTDMMKTRKPLLFALLRFDILHVSATEQKLFGSAREELDRLLDRKNERVRSVSVALGLERRKLLSDARLRLPFWQAVPLLRGVVAFVKRAFLGEPSPKRRQRRMKKQAGKGKQPEGHRGQTGQSGETESAGQHGSDTAVFESTELQFGERPNRSRKEQASRTSPTPDVKRAAQNLAQEYVRSGADVDTTLEELAERWNPLLDPVAQNNLVEDVNSLVRDFLRRRRTVFRSSPPTRTGIQQMSAQLAQNPALAEIKRKEPLRRYLELYMLRILGK